MSPDISVYVCPKLGCQFLKTLEGETVPFLYCIGMACLRYAMENDIFHIFLTLQIRGWSGIEREHVDLPGQLAHTASVFGGFWSSLTYIPGSAPMPRPLQWDAQRPNSCQNPPPAAGRFAVDTTWFVCNNVTSANVWPIWLRPARQQTNRNLRMQRRWHHCIEHPNMYCGPHGRAYVMVDHNDHKEQLQNAAYSLTACFVAFKPPRTMTVRLLKVCTLLWSFKMASFSLPQSLGNSPFLHEKHALFRAWW